MKESKVRDKIRNTLENILGNVPALLIPSSPEKHPGTLDLDFALDFQHIEDDTYKTIVEVTVETIGPVWVADFLEISDSEERARVQTNSSFRLCASIYHSPSASFSISFNTF